MIDIVVNYGALIAYLAFTIDTGLQIKRVSDRKSAQDISVSGTVIRFFAGLMLFIKMTFTNDPYLILGQGAFSGIFLIYLVLVIYYRVKEVKV